MAGNISLAQQYNYINWRRRVAKIYQQRLLESKSSAQVQAIRAYIVSGNDPRENPEYRDIYYCLVNEFGDSYFQDEWAQFYLHKEEDKRKQETIEQQQKET